MNENKKRHKTAEVGPQRHQILELSETENKIAACVICEEIKGKPESKSMKSELTKTIQADQKRNQSNL